MHLSLGTWERATTARLPSTSSTTNTDWGGIGDARVVGKFVEYSMSLGDGTYVLDLTDDGLDVHLWVLYGRTLDYTRTEDIGDRVGPQRRPVDVRRGCASTISAWACAFGSGEERCSGWEG